MPAILIQLLSLLGGLGTSALASKAATRFAAPALGKLAGKIAPGLAEKTAFGQKLGSLGTSAVNTAGFLAGFPLGEAAVHAALGGEEAPEPDPISQALSAMRQQMVNKAEESQVLGQMFEEKQVRDVLEMLGVDFNEFVELASSRRGGLV